MPAHNLYIASSATVAGTALKGYVAVTINERASVARPSGDGKIWGELTGVYRVEEQVTIEAEDTGVSPAIGAQGALSITNARLAGGTSLSGSLTIATASGASVTVIEVERFINSEGRPRLRVVAIANSSNGTSAALTYSTGGGS